MELREPPILAEKLLMIICKEELQEEIIGDLHQHFADMRGAKASWIRLKYWYHVLQFLRPFALKPAFKNSIIRTMIRLNLLVAYRNMLRNKLYSSINIFGLALGLSTCILIGIFVKDELTYDKHWQDYQRIYRVAADLKFNDSKYDMASSPAPMAAAFKQDFPEIEVSGRIADVGGDVIKVGEKYFNESDLAFADQSILEIFIPSVISGTTTEALSQPNTVILAESTAMKYFSTTDIVGESIELDGHQFKINAVIKDFPGNSHFHFSMLLSMESWPDSKSPIWLGNNYKTYFKLQEGASYDQLEGKFEDVYEKYFGPQLEQYAGASYEQMLASGSYVRYYLQPIESIHLESNLSYEIEANGNAQYVYILVIAGIFVMLIASINFINISTARSSLRAKEVGMRKVMGSIRGQLIFQFLIESMLNAIIALILAVLLVHLFLPTFNALTEKNIVNPLFGALAIWKETIGLALVIGLIAGIYPAFYLSKFIPAQVLKGRLKLGIGSGKLRNSLVVIQLTASVLMIFGSIVIFSQLSYSQDKSLGFNKEQVIIINETTTLNEKIDEFKEELLQNPAISKATITSYLPTANSSRSDSPLIKKGSSVLEETIGIQQWRVDEFYIETLELDLIEGRNFSKLLASDSAAVILNEEAVRRFGLQNPIGARLTTIPGANSNPIEYEIVGVISDFHFDNFRTKIEPLCLKFLPSNGKISLRYDASKTKEVVNFIDQKWSEFNPSIPIDMDFMDQQFAASYKSEEKLSALFTSFAVFSIIIACLGLFGLAAFTTDQKKKEVGIRKVLGATVSQLMKGQLTYYTKLILISLIISLPVGHYFMNEWLQNFAYKTSIGFGTYFFPALIVISFAWITVSFISYRAATQNPVYNLHDE